jgi:hypothetical protein
MFRPIDGPSSGAIQQYYKSQATDFPLWIHGVIYWLLSSRYLTSLYHIYSLFSVCLSLIHFLVMSTSYFLLYSILYTLYSILYTLYPIGEVPSLSSILTQFWAAEHTQLLPPILYTLYSIPYRGSPLSLEHTNTILSSRAHTVRCSGRPSSHTRLPVVTTRSYSSNVRRNFPVILRHLQFSARACLPTSLCIPPYCSALWGQRHHLSGSVAWVRERTIQTESPPLIGEVSPFADKGCRLVSMTDSYGRVLGFLDRSRYFSFQVAPQLYSRGWVNPVLDPLLLRKTGSVGNPTRTSGSVARNSDH